MSHKDDTIIQALLIVVIALFLIWAMGDAWAAEMIEYDERWLAAPFIVGLILSWSCIWVIKFVWRDLHPNFQDRLQNSTVVVLAIVSGGLLSLVALWVLRNFLLVKIGYPVAILEGYIGYPIATGVLSPLLFGLLLWFVNTELDLKVYKKPAWPRLYEFLNVAHRPDIDYTNGHSDLTRMPEDPDKTPTPK